MNTISSKINRILLLLFMSMIHITAIAQSSDWNYVQTKTFLDENASTFLRHIDYYDELGVVSETVDVGGNTTNTPIITRTDYNSQLKPELLWAPLSATSLDYKSNYNNHTATENYNDWPTYTENQYDDFQQLESSCKPGGAWYEHPVTTTRNMVPAGVVKKYSVDANGNLCDADTLTYSYGLLTSTTTTDEDGKSITVYTDMLENTILERRGMGNDFTDTYYIYDKFNRLSYVLPPMCQECSTTSEMSKYWYKYKYDNRGRCIEKQLPDCEPVKYWYDNTNRIQSEQDGHLREQGMYRNYSYDAIGRIVLQTISKTCGVATESNAKVVETKKYYDDYTSCLSELSQAFSIWADSINAKTGSQMVARGKPTATLCTTSDGLKYFELYRYDSKGRLTYQLSAYSDKWLKSVYSSYNFVGDILSVQESVYTHQDYRKVLLARRRTRNAYHPETRLLDNTTVTHIDKNGKTTTQIVSRPSYDVFGNITANDRPGTAADMMYTYDTLHGWVKEISSPSGFCEELLRETAPKAQLSGNIGRMQWRNTKYGELHKYDYTYDCLGRLTDAEYSSSAEETKNRYDEIVRYNKNGSIESLQRYGMKNDGTFGMIDNLAINYDGNRLTKVTDDAEALNYNDALDFHDGADMECEYEYDSNGALTRDSNRGIKSITYDYGHHPSYVNMNVGRELKNITYDYTPDGRKLSSRHVMYLRNEHGAIKNTTTDLYVDGMILRDGKPQTWQFDGGYVELDANGTPTSWNYYITDHLGSTRKVVDSNNNIKETINYYPFGSEMRMSNPYQIIRKNSNMNLETASFVIPSDSDFSIKDPGILMPKDSVTKGNEPYMLAEDYWQPYRFSGKELDKQNGLNMYDFGARLFDVAGVPVWTSVDPLAEDNPNVTPYMYCAGDPVNRVDPDGEDWFETDYGEIRWQPDVSSQDDLQKGYTYIGKSFIKDNVIYRDDGAIMFPLEYLAYLKMLDRLKHSKSKKHPLGKEQESFVLEDGSVMLMPDNWNDCETSTFTQAGFTLSENNILTDSKGEKYKCIAQVHTHTRGADKGLSNPDDWKFAGKHPDMMVYILHGDGFVYNGYFSSKKNKNVSTSFEPILVKSLINRKQNLWQGTKNFFKSH